MSITERRPFSWLGGRPALDFVNTRAWFVEQPASERFRAASDVIEWGVEASLLTEAEAAALLEGCRDATFAGALLEEALKLRAHLHTLLRTVASEERIPGVILEGFNRRLSSAAASTQVTATESPRVFRFRWTADRTDPDCLFRQLVVGAAKILTSSDAARLRMCGNDRCGWMFLDTSRNGRRRWCDMSVCGNRVKSRRRYARKKEADVSEPEERT